MFKDKTRQKKRSNSPSQSQMGKWTLFKPLLTDVTFSLVEGVSQLTDGVARYSALFEYYSAALLVF